MNAKWFLGRRLSQTCAWCGRLLAEDEPVQTLGLAAGPEVDLSELRGSWIPFPLLSGKIVPAMVSTEDSPAKRDGWDFILMTCSEECAARLKEALEQEREWFEARRAGD